MKCRGIGPSPKKAAESGDGALSRAVQLSDTLLSLEEGKTDWNTLIHSP
jgi:hypothetical protein